MTVKYTNIQFLAPVTMVRLSKEMFDAKYKDYEVKPDYDENSLGYESIVIVGSLDMWSSQWEPANQESQHKLQVICDGELTILDWEDLRDASDWYISSACV